MHFQAHCSKLRGLSSAGVSMSPKVGEAGHDFHPPQVEGALEALAPILPGWVNPPRARAWSGLCDSEFAAQPWLKSPGNRRTGHRAPLSSPTCNNPAHLLSLPSALLPPGDPLEPKPAPPSSTLWLPGQPSYLQWPSSPSPI